MIAGDTKANAQRDQITVFRRSAIPRFNQFQPPSTYFTMETFLRAESTTEQILDALSLRVERQLSTCD